MGIADGCAAGRVNPAFFIACIVGNASCMKVSLNFFCVFRIARMVFVVAVGELRNSAAWKFFRSFQIGIAGVIYAAGVNVAFFLRRIQHHKAGAKNFSKYLCAKKAASFDAAFCLNFEFLLPVNFDFNVVVGVVRAVSV